MRYVAGSARVGVDVSGPQTVTRRLGWRTDKHGRRLLLTGDHMTYAAR